MYKPQGADLMSPLDASRGINRGGGKTFYVSNLTSTDQSDDYEGTNPQYPLATIEAAVSKCTTQKNDYIFVQDSYDQDTEPVTIAKRDVHLIGLSSGVYSSNRCIIDGNGQAAIQLSSDDDGIEIAGFELGSTGAGDACILVSPGALFKGHIHDCSFGHLVACQDGIVTPSTEMSHCVIDNNYFGRLIGRHCLNLYAPTDTFIINNIFKDWEEDAIYISGPNTVRIGVIMGNRFFQQASGDQGCAIYITDGKYGMITDNIAMEDGAHPGNNPYLDTSGPANAWGLNWSGNTAVYPDTS